MAPCEKCRRTNVHTEWRISEQNLCDECELIRIQTLAEEKKSREERQRPLRSSVSTDTIAVASGADVPDEVPVNGDRGIVTESPRRNSPKTKKSAKCMAGCKASTKKGSAGNQIQCCLCTHWYHERCVGISPNEKVGFWPCPNCRTISSNIQNLNENMQDLISLVQSSETRQRNLEAEVLELKKINTTLLEQQATILNATKSDNSLVSDATQHPHPPSLLIGSSLIRNIDEGKLNDYTVCCMPGARNIHVKNKLQQFADTRSRFRSITVLVGGNDAATSSDQFDLASSAQCMRDIVDLSKQMSEDVDHAFWLPAKQKARKPKAQKQKLP